MAKKKVEPLPPPPPRKLTLTEERIKLLYEDLKKKAYDHYKEGDYKESGAYKYAGSKLLEIIETF